MSPEFLLTSLIVVVSPGPGMVYTIAAGLSRGRAASLLAAFGCTLGTVPHMLAAITGLAALLHASATAFEVIKWFGVGYLLWMAWRSLQAQGPLRVDAASSDAPAASDTAGTAGVVRAALLVNLLNPKLSIFFFAFLPQFVSAEGAGATRQMVLLSLVFMAITFAVFVIYGVFAAAMRQRVLARPAVLAALRRAFSAAFVLLAARLATTSR